MRINCNIMLDPGETFAPTSDEAATAVLTALGGDTASDYCTVYVQSPPDSGQAGTLPAVEPVVLTPPPE